MNASALRAAREARGWLVTDVARALGVSAARVRAWEMGRRPVPADVVAWWGARAPLPAPHGAPVEPTKQGLRALMVAREITTKKELAAATGIHYGTIWRWIEDRVAEDHAITNLRLRAWLALGAPPDWWPPALGTADGAPPPAAQGSRAGRIRALPPSPGPGWVWLADEGAWAPPSAHCEPEDDYQKVVGCDVCAWRMQCAALRPALARVS